MCQEGEGSGEMKGAGITAGPRAPIRVALILCVLLAGSLLGAVAAGAATNVTTAGYNNLRDDWDPAEPGLGPAAIQSAGFGKLFATKLEGAIYAQPLVYEGRLIVTTEKANAYALDPATGSVLWKRSFGKPFKASTIGCSDLKPDLGSTSTPVIDPSTGTIYLTTRLQIGKGIAGSRTGTCRRSHRPTAKSARASRCRSPGRRTTRRACRSTKASRCSVPRCCC